MSEYRSEIITDFARLETLAADWDRLWKADRRATVFGSFSWARAIWRSYGTTRSLCTPVVWRDGEVAGILPLACVEGTLRFVGWPRSDYNDMLVAPAVGAEAIMSAFRALADARVTWRHCVLENVPEDSNLFPQWTEIGRQTGLTARASFHATCARLDLSIEPDRIVEILKRKSLRRYEKGLERLGRLEFRHLDTRDEAMAHLATFFRQHIGRWAMAGERSIFRDAPARDFFKSLVEELDPSTELRFSVVEVGGKPVAYHFGFESNGVFVLYKPIFDIDYWECSPGKVLLKRLFEYVSERDLRIFDFTVGDESYKEEFANSVGNNYTLHAFRPGIKAAPRRFVFRAKETLKSHPSAFRGVKRVADALREVTSAAHRSAAKEGASHAIRKLCSAAWRRTLLDHDVVLVFLRDNNSRGGTNLDISLKQSSLSDLASFAVDGTEVAQAPRLARARQMLRQGDTAYTAWQGGQLVQVAWAGMHSELPPTPVGDECQIQLERPSLVIHDCWTPPHARDSDSQSAVLDMLVSCSGPASNECWTYCSQRDVAAVRNIAKAGFKLRFRMRRIRIFGRFDVNRVHEEPVSADGVFPSTATSPR